MFAKFICSLFAPLFNDQRFIDAVVSRLVDTRLDYADLGQRVCREMKADTICKNIASHINVNHLAEVVCDTIDMDDVKQFMAKSVSASDLAEYIDIDDVAEKVDITARAVAEEINLSDLAGELNYRELTSEIEIDYSEIASNLDMSDIGNECVQHLDMEEIASNLNMCEIAGEIELADLASEINYEELAKALLAQFVKDHAKATTVEVRTAST